MSNDPAFLFYPGDYLRDTQCLSEKTQVAYDRIICEHMRNICISQQQLKFFTKRLSEEEIEELKSVLTKINGGFQITWVAESIVKRREYSESRRKNRKKDMNNICRSYDEHMENENENENEDITKKKVSKKFIPPTMEEVMDYFTQNGYSSEAGTKAWKYYNEADWHDSKGTKVKNWKQKMQAVWFKEENKTKISRMEEVKSW